MSEPEFGPVQPFMSVERFLLIERRMKLAEQLRQDAEKLRRLLDDGDSSTVS